MDAQLKESATVSDGDADPGDDALAIAGFIGGGVACLAYLMGLLLWTARQASAVLTGHGWPDSTPGGMSDVLLALARSPGDPAHAWPDPASQVGPNWLIYAIFALFMTPVFLVAYVLVRAALNWRRRREFRRLRLGFASGLEIRRMLSGRAVARKAKSVRPSYRGRRRIDPTDVGFYLGRDIRSQQKLHGSVEDVFIILAPPRQGKDVHFCAPYTIDAPGACIVTSTRADAFTNTYAMRAKVGDVHVFDPNGLTNWPERLRWSPVRGCEDPIIAANRAAAFVTGSGLEVTGDNAYWVAVSISILRCYLHAAALGGMTMRDVKRWSTQSASLEPVNLLRRAEQEGLAAPGWAGELEACVAEEPRRRAYMWANLVQALTCFSDPNVMDACSPAPDEEFDMKEFLSRRNTLYVLGKEQKNASIAPVVTSMMEDMFDSARKIASRMPGSRMDPPLTVELNEAAHIAPLPNLPAYMGDSGGFSIALHVYLQSLAQARARWGEDEAKIMWDNAAVRVIMGGAGSIGDLNEISQLMGDYLERRKIINRRPGGQSESEHREYRPVLNPEEVRTLPFGRAVVVARAARPVEVKLTPWWKRKDGDEIAKGKAKTEKLLLAYAAEQDGKLRRAAARSAR